MNDAIRISSPADILGFIPHTLGFAPRESFVFLTLCGNTLGATLRVDAPLFGDPAGFARSMVGYLAVDEQATSVLLAIYTDCAPAAAAQRPFHDHVEAVIQEKLFELMEGKTVIAIAHRLSTIAAMDRLIVLDKGKIVEQGSHAELVAAGGLYSELWARQSGGFLVEPEQTDSDVAAE